MIKAPNAAITSLSVAFDTKTNTVTINTSGRTYARKTARKPWDSFEIISTRSPGVYSPCHFVISISFSWISEEEQAPLAWHETHAACESTVITMC